MFKNGDKLICISNKQLDDYSTNDVSHLLTIGKIYECFEETDDEIGIKEINSRPLPTYFDKRRFKCYKKHIFETEMNEIINE